MSLPSIPPAHSGRLALIILLAASSYGWWHWRRTQPDVDADAAHRLRPRGAA